MEERGISLVEVMLSFLIAALFLSSSFYIYVHLSMLGGRSYWEWHAFWKVKEFMKDWQMNHTELQLETEGYSIELQQKPLVPGLREGVFTISWKEEIKKTKHVFYAYKKEEL